MRMRDEVWDVHVFLAEFLVGNSEIKERESIPDGHLGAGGDKKIAAYYSLPISFLVTLSLSLSLCIVEKARWWLGWWGIKMSAALHCCCDGGGAIELAVDSRRFVVAFRAA